MKHNLYELKEGHENELAILRDIETLRKVLVAMLEKEVKDA